VRCCAEAAPVIVASASRESRILAIGCFGMYENVCTFYAHSNTEMRTVACEPAHISPRLSGREYGWRRTQAMTQQFTRIPRWLTNDLLVIVVGMAIIGALAWIAPF